jgi:hypothetical protein
MHFSVFLHVFTHITLRIDPYKRRKVHALMASGCGRRHVSKQSWQSQFLDGFKYYSCVSWKSGEMRKARA